MSREMSIYLDVTRFIAAVAVMLGHLSGSRFTGGFLWQIAPFMSEAVAVFFVLSGFVIAHTVTGQEKQPMIYVIARAARIYSVAIPALMITFLLDHIGSLLRPDLYSLDWGFQADGRILQFVSGLVFVNEFWGNHIPQGSALPYWSLGYEVWYYVIFGIAWYVTKPWRGWLIIAFLVAAGPQIAVMFPLWLLGVAAYWVSRHISSNGNSMRGLLLWAVSLFAWGMYETKLRGLIPLLPDRLGVRDFPASYIVGFLFTANLLAFQLMSKSMRPLLLPAERIIRYLAGATFTIYLLHLPVAQFLTTLVHQPPSAIGTRLIIIVGTTMILFVIAEFTERKKQLWRWGIANLVARCGALAR